MCESLLGTINWAAMVLLYVAVGTIAFVLILRNRHLHRQLMKLAAQRERECKCDCGSCGKAGTERE